MNGRERVFVVLDRETKRLQSEPYIYRGQSLGVGASESSDNGVCQTAQGCAETRIYFFASFRQREQRGNPIALLGYPDIEPLAVVQQFGQFQIGYIKIGFVVLIHLTRRLSHGV